jgi:hypothetical protein
MQTASLEIRIRNHFILMLSKDDTPSLNPASSPRRRRIVRRLLENSRDWIGRTIIRTTRTGQQLFPLLGERIKGEGGRKTLNPST